MSSNSSTRVRVVLYEGEGSKPLEATARFDLLRSLLDRGYSVTLPAVEGRVSVADQGAVLALGRFGGVRPEDQPANTDHGPLGFKDLDQISPAQVVEVVDSFRTDQGATRPGEWKPWFPVIDYDRCTNCMQCLSFCLFGVYGVDEGRRLEVQNQDQCKTNCPACSRVCPEAAIMFPKYKAGPINGEMVTEADLQREKMKIDISALLGGDVYAMLRDRSDRAKSRFSKERDSEKALKERQKCLVKLAQSGDIPMEVLMSLPSPEEIQRRAVEAAAKAEAARAPVVP